MSDLQLSEELIEINKKEKQNIHSTEIPTKKLKVLWMSDNVLISSGMAVVGREILLGLHRTGKYQLTHLGWGFNGFPHNFPVPILPASAPDFGKNGVPQAGIPSFQRVIEMCKPDVVIALGDAWMLNYIKDLPNRKSFKLIQYSPIDGSPIPQVWINWFKDADSLVMYSEFGSKEIEKIAPELKSSLIYHGVKSDVYKPLPQDIKSRIKKTITFQQVEGNQLVTKIGLPDNAFVVGVIARNQPRKNFDRIIKSFAKFAKNKPDVRLWLHSAITDAAYNLAELAIIYGIADKVCFTPNYNLANGVSEHDLNSLMNVFDVHFLPTQGEGFGLPILESMSAGVPQVVTDYSAHVEWCKSASILIPLTEDDFILSPNYPVERAVPKITESAKCLEKIYLDKSLREELSKNAREVAISMSWEKTIPQWELAIEEVMKEKSNEAKVIKI